MYNTDERFSAQEITKVTHDLKHITGWKAFKTYQELTTHGRQIIKQRGISKELFAI